MKITRNMIASKAGVTPTTVSCVLNNTRPVSDKVKQRVLQAVEELNYIPDMAARSMLGKSTKQICIMVDSIKNPFLAELVCGIESEGTKKGYFVSICGKLDLKKYVQHLIARKIDAVYFCSEIKQDEEKYIRQLLDNNIKVLTGPKFKYYRDELSFVDMATGESVRKAIGYLISNGHSKIGFLNSFREGTERDDRLAVFVEEMTKNKLEIRQISPEKTVDASIEKGKELFRQLINKYPDTTAIIGLNDLVAIGGMQQAKEMGYSIPDDISFIGIDGIELSQLVTPKLTTFRSNVEQLGEKIFTIIEDMIVNNNKTSYVHSMVFSEGDSVKKLKK